MPDRHPKQRRLICRLFIAVCVVGCLISPAPAVVAQGFEDIPESRANDESLEGAIARVLAAGAEPAGLRAIHGGVELFDPETGRALRQFLSDRPATAWCHARDAQWFVALAGGEVLNVDFQSRETERVAKFDGDVYWLHDDGDLAWPRIDRAIAEHHIEGVGQARLLYHLSGDPNITRVESIDSSFDSVHEDGWGRLWLLPSCGGRMTSLSYIDIDAGTPHRISVPPMPNGDERVFGGVVEAPGERLFIWGQRRIGAEMKIEYMAELIPPVFDDGVWAELDAFDNFRLENRFSRERLLEGELTVVYDTEKSSFRLIDAMDDESWVLPDGENRWVKELFFDNAQQWVGPALPFFGRYANVSAMSSIEGETDWRDGPAPPLPEDWPEGYVDRLHHSPENRAERIADDEPTDLLAGLFLGDLIADEAQRVQVCSACDTEWILGLDTGQIVYFDDVSGKFQLLTEVEGTPLAISIRRGNQWMRKTLVILYRPNDSQDDAFCWQMMTSLSHDRWCGDAQESREANAGPERAWPAPTARRLELRQADDGNTELVWTQHPNGRELIDRAVPQLNGLFVLPDNSVIGYGSTGTGNLPIMVRIENDTVDVFWWPVLPWFGECSPRPEGEITHARYIPEAGRILLIADDQLWSTGPWLIDWRPEGTELPDGFGEASEE